MTRRVKTLLTAAAGIAACLAALPASAQLRPVRPARPLPRPGAVEISGGVVLTPGFDLGSATAELTRNPGTGTGPYDLFTADTSVGAAAGVQGRVGVYVTRTLSFEAGAQYSRPVLSTSLANDAEEAASTVATETLARYVFDGSALYHFGKGRSVPFVIAGGGYIRELHDGYGVVTTGNEFHAGAGLKYWFQSGRHKLGLRVEGRAISRSGGVDFGDSRRAFVAGEAGITYLF